jgi:hypothetical protein
MTASLSRISLVAACAALCTAATMASCSSKASAPAAPAVTTPVNTAVLIGDMKPLVSVKELMKYMIDPASDYIFDSVKTLIRPDGRVVEIMPKTEEDWEKLRIGAVTLAEGVYLLKVQRPLTPSGDVNNSVGPDATELSPTEIAAKINKDPVEWNARIEALRNVGLEVLEIVAKKNTKELWDASENLDVACEQCHASYWYPKEDKAFYRALDKKLHDLPAPKAFSTAPKR